MPGELAIDSTRNEKNMLLFSWPFKMLLIGNLYADHVLRFGCLSKIIFQF